MVLCFLYSYPAGFVYIYLALYYITGYGHNIRLGQYLFAGLYILSLIVLFNIYRKTNKVSNCYINSVFYKDYEISKKIWWFMIYSFVAKPVIWILWGLLNTNLARPWEIFIDGVIHLSTHCHLSILFYHLCKDRILPWHLYQNYFKKPPKI